MIKCTKQRARKHQAMCKKTLTTSEKAKQTKHSKTFTMRALTKWKLKQKKWFEVQAWVFLPFIQARH